MLIKAVAQRLRMSFRILRKYIKRAMPTRRKLLQRLRRNLNRIQIVLRRELRYNTGNFLEIMRRLADEHLEFAENVETTTRILLQTEEEGPKPKKRPPKNDRNTNNSKNKQQARMHRTQSHTRHMPISRMYGTRSDLG